MWENYSEIMSANFNHRVMGGERYIFVPIGRQQ